MKRVIVGLSGGVDSSVAAYLLKQQGYEVIGLFMKNWHDDSVTISKECPWLEDSNDAMLVADKLGIPFQVVDLSEEYKERIVDYMFREYEQGRTPNPDVLCNREIKFDVFMKIALDLGADFVAPVATANKKVTIAGISGLTGKQISNNNSASHTLRLLIPGTIDANIDVTINSNDGNFIPEGLSQFNVKNQKVLDIPLTFAPVNQHFSLIIASVQSVLASVLSEFAFGKSKEIAWATGADDLSKWSANLSGSKPVLSFSGNKINIQISATTISGKKIDKKISGTDFLVWNAPSGLNRLQITANGKGITGGVIFFPEVGSIGSSYIPMNNGANLETASEPISDASVISRG